MPAGTVCLLGSFCVCLPTQLGVSHPGSGPNGRRDTADWSQRVFSALPRVWLHHHAAGWHVRESSCTHAPVGAACMNPSAFIFAGLHVQINTGSSVHWVNLCPCNNLFVAYAAVPQTSMEKWRKSYPAMTVLSWQLSNRRSKQIETAAHCALEQFLMQMSQWWRPF